MTNRLFYKLTTSSDWTDGGTRTGDGTIAQSGLTVDAEYQFQAISDNGVFSKPSNVVILTVRATPANTTPGKKFEAALIYALKNATAVKALVGSNIFPVGEVPEDLMNQTGAPPMITEEIVDDSPNITMGGDSGLRCAKVLVAPFARSKLTVAEIMDAIGQDPPAGLQCLTGAMGAAGAQVDVQGCFVEANKDQYAPPDDASGRGYWSPHVRLEFWYTEA